MLKSSYLLHSDKARQLYDTVKTLPICDYHCHLSPKEIYDDEPFCNIAQMWLAGDHYKWRLMRTCGVDEEYITGNADWKDKFVQYAKSVENAAFNPLYEWTKMELSMYFGIDEPLNEANAINIYEKANAVIKSEKLSPRRLIERSRVKYIATTDDIIDDLSWHEKIAADRSIDTIVAPSFRTDNLMLMQKDGWREWIKKLSDICKIEINGIDSLCAALKNRLDFFCAHGCKIADVGIPYFPDSSTGNADKSEIDNYFKKALGGDMLEWCEYSEWLAFLYIFLAGEYKKRNIVSQWHLSVMRNTNSKLYEKCGADCGCDCISDIVSGNDVAALLDKINNNSAMPTTILYTLNPTLCAQLGSVAGAFCNVRLGAAWWFCDTRRGIIDQLHTIGENSSLGTFFGMLTDSRSFLSYARHDYFRRIICDEIGTLVEHGEFDENAAKTLVGNVSYYNAERMFER